MEDLSLSECLVRGQHYASEWLAEHPKWMLSRWRCERNIPRQKPALAQVEQQRGSDRL